MEVVIEYVFKFGYYSASRISGKGWSRTREILSHPKDTAKTIKMDKILPFLIFISDLQRVLDERHAEREMIPNRLSFGHFYLSSDSTIYHQRKHPPGRQTRSESQQHQLMDKSRLYETSRPYLSSCGFLDYAMVARRINAAGLHSLPTLIWFALVHTSSSLQYKPRVACGQASCWSVFFP